MGRRDGLRRAPASRGNARRRRVQRRRDGEVARATGCGRGRIYFIESPPRYRRVIVISHGRRRPIDSIDAFRANTCVRIIITVPLYRAFRENHEGRRFSSAAAEAAAEAAAVRTRRASEDLDRRYRPTPMYVSTTNECKNTVRRGYHGTTGTVAI